METESEMKNKDVKHRTRLVEQMALNWLEKAHKEGTVKTNKEILEKIDGLIKDHHNEVLVYAPTVKHCGASQCYQVKIKVSTTRYRIAGVPVSDLHYL